MRRTLSSVTTLVPMFVRPLILVWCLVGSTVAAYREPHGIVAVIVVGAFILISGYYSWHLCFASTDGESLFLWSFRGAATVALSDIQSVEATSKGRTPRIEIHFRAPIKFGKKIIIMPPGSFSGDAFWNVYEFLAESADEAKHDQEHDVSSRHAAGKRQKFMLGIWLVLVITVLALFYSVPTQKKPNQAPEPTPGSVTPRAK